MQLQRASLRASPTGARPARGLRMAVRSTQVDAVEAAAAAEAPAAAPSNSGGAEIYLGFEKGDYAPRAGRKGRVIKDDPSKYPSKEDLGLLSGATGGWAGGEAGLWKLREEVLAQKAAAKGGAPAPPAPAAPAANGNGAAAAGGAPIYLGYGKKDLELRKAGVPGRVIVDDPAKYPAKEDVGFFSGATGGFAAGEVGLKQFVQDGELKLRREGGPGVTQSSPVTFLGWLLLGGVGGGLLLNSVGDLATGVIQAAIVDAPHFDESTKTLLLGGTAAISFVTLILAGRETMGLLDNKEGRTASKLAAIGGAYVAAFIGARAILEL